jgi:hypothetical protein
MNTCVALTIHFLLTHQPLLIAVIGINGASLALLIIGISFRPHTEEEGAIR